MSYERVIICENFNSLFFFVYHQSITQQQLLLAKGLQYEMALSALEILQTFGLIWQRYIISKYEN